MDEKLAFRAGEPGAWRWQVLLGGHPLDLVAEASVPRGEVRVYAPDHGGYVDLGAPRLVTLRGLVEIVPRPAPNESEC